LDSYDANWISEVIGKRWGICRGSIRRERTGVAKRGRPIERGRVHAKNDGFWL